MKLLNARAGLKGTQEPVTHPRPPSCRFNSGQSIIDARYAYTTYPDFSNIDKSTADCYPVAGLHIHSSFREISFRHQTLGDYCTKSVRTRRIRPDLLPYTLLHDCVLCMRNLERHCSAARTDQQVVLRRGDVRLSVRSSLISEPSMWTMQLRMHKTTF
jgi:hypothetical protein